MNRHHRRVAPLVALPAILAAAILALHLLAGPLAGDSGDPASPEVDASPRIVLGAPAMLSRIDMSMRLRPLVDPLRADPALDVDVVVSPSHAAFLRAAREGRFDVVLVPAHLGPILARGGRYETLARATGPRQIDLFALAEGGIHGVADLAGRRVALPPAASLASLVARDVLTSHGQLPGSGFRVVESPGQDQAILKVLGGDADAGAAFRSVLSLLEPGLRARLRILASVELPEIAFLMVRSDLDPSLRKRLAARQRRFGEAEREESAGSPSALGLGTFVAAGDDRLRAVEPWAARAEALLDPSRPVRGPPVPEAPSGR